MLSSTLESSKNLSYTKHLHAENFSTGRGFVSGRGGIGFSPALLI
jgi:hypothetical protein